MKKTCLSGSEELRWPNKSDLYCQLQDLDQATRRPAWTDGLRLAALRLLRALEKRLGGADYPLAQTLGDHSSLGGAIAVRQPARALREGEWVSVLSLAEILTQLDADNRTSGLEFLPGMADYCGRQLRVLKRVRTIFDERAWKMVATRDVYLLEGCLCDGSGMFDKEGCDRCCYYFWKGAWLTPAKPPVETRKGQGGGGHGP